MIQISFHPYKLVPLKAVNAVTTTTAREGALLKVEWEGMGIGYADLHPWPEFGDLSLQQQLEDMRRKKFSAQVQQSIWFAERDVQARHDKKSILSYGVPVKNNYLISSYADLTPALVKAIQEQGFETIKLKCGKDFIGEVRALNSLDGTGLRIRLDFNASIDEAAFRKFLGELSSEVLASIEYVEDPFEYKAVHWQEMNELVPLAIDNELAKVEWSKVSARPFAAVVVKPAKTNVEDVLEQCLRRNIKMTITSNMDHPVGVMHAVAVAGEYKKSHPDLMLEAGCLTHSLYQAEAFSNLMKTQGPYLHPVPGVGIGFDQLLAEVPWQPLVRL